MQSNDIFPIYLFIVHVERETMMFTCFWASLGNELTWSLDLGGATQKKKYENERGSFSGGCLRTRRVTNVWEKKKKFCFWIQKRGIKPVFSPICIFIKVCVCVLLWKGITFSLWKRGSLMASDKNLFFHGTVYTHGSMNCLPLAGVFVLDVVIFGMQK